MIRCIWSHSFSERDRVLAEHDRAETGGDDRGDTGPERTGKAGQAGVGFDFEEIPLDAETPGVELRAALEILSLAVLRVNIDWAD